MRDLLEISSRPAVTVTEDADLEIIASLMREHQVGCVFVIDDGGRVSGVVTDHDIVVRALARGWGVGTQARHIMSTDVACIGHDRTVCDAGLQMAIHHHHRLPVVDESGRPLGVVANDDLSRARSAAADGCSLGL
jgi:CBS domain-containing protein